MGQSTVRFATLAAVAVTSALALGACGGGSATTRLAAAHGAALDAPALPTRPVAAPEIALHNSLGQPVRLSALRGKAVMLTFIYDHCPDICPAIVGNFHAALERMGPAAASHVVFVAVSVDPRGDTPATVEAFLAKHGMTGRMDYLIGSRHELEPVWREYGVKVEASPDSREVGHSAFVYGVSGSGKISALYPANFKPGWIVHDVPLLAQE